MSMKERIESNILLANDCWEWQASISDKGYGRLKVKGKYRFAHRISYEVYKGEIPAGMLIRHQCDNPKCVNPAHLLPGTPRENMNDMFSRGRQPSRVGEMNGRAKLSQKEVGLIRDDPRRQVVIAKHYGISQTQVSLIKTHKKWNSLEVANEQ